LRLFNANRDKYSFQPIAVFDGGSQAPGGAEIRAIRA
jgi:hypothetical protein